ncbi:MAG: fused MFS/spermidine synthase [Candidatus Njordarchaeales archaeon]
MTRKQQVFRKGRLLMAQWIGERNKKLGISILFKIKGKPIIRPAIFFKSIIITATDALGKILVFEEEEDYTTIQIAEKWDTYSEMLVHVAMCAHPNPSRVLIIGGGDGGTAREVLKHDTVKEVTIVEIDEKVIEACKDFLKIDNGALSSKRTRIVIKDGLEYLEDYNGEPYDIILGDWTDPYIDTPAEKLITEKFFAAAHKALAPNGILVTQSGSPIFQQEITRRTFKTAKKFFKNVFLYTAPVPFYPGGLWSFVIASNTIDPRTPIRSVRGTIYYNRNIHEAVFVLPTFLKEIYHEE